MDSKVEIADIMVLYIKEHIQAFALFRQSCLCFISACISLATGQELVKRLVSMATSLLLDLEATTRLWNMDHGYHDINKP